MANDIYIFIVSSPFKIIGYKLVEYFTVCSFFIVTLKVKATFFFIVTLKVKATFAYM